MSTPHAGLAGFAVNTPFPSLLASRPHTPAFLERLAAAAERSVTAGKAGKDVRKQRGSQAIAAAKR